MMMIASAMQKFLLAPLERNATAPYPCYRPLGGTARYYPLLLPPPVRWHCSLLSLTPATAP